MKNFRLTFKDIFGNVIFSTIISAKSMRGARRKAINLEPGQFCSRSIVSLETEFYLKLDKIEFNY